MTWSLAAASSRRDGARPPFSGPNCRACGAATASWSG